MIEGLRPSYDRVHECNSCEQALQSRSYSAGKSFGCARIHWIRRMAWMRSGIPQKNTVPIITRETYNPGDPITEPAGPDHVHLGRNLGTTPLIFEVIYIKPAGKPLAEDAANPGCPFA